MKPSVESPNLSSWPKRIWYIAQQLVREGSIIVLLTMDILIRLLIENDVRIKVSSKVIYLVPIIVLEEDSSFCKESPQSFHIMQLCFFRKRTDRRKNDFNRKPRICQHQLKQLLIFPHRQAHYYESHFHMIIIPNIIK